VHNYGIIDHMAAELIFSSKFIYPDGSIREMILWKLPERSTAYPQGFKYRLHYGYPDGRTMVRYDNEKGKGDHRHIKNREKAYVFTSVKALVADFLSDIEKVRGGTK
jgi:hypothetical protein